MSTGCSAAPGTELERSCTRNVLFDAVVEPPTTSHHPAQTALLCHGAAALPHLVWARSSTLLIDPKRHRVRPPMGAPTCDTNSRPAGQPGRGGPQLLLQGPPVQLFIEQPTAIPRRGSPNTERPGSTGGRGTEEPLIRTRSLALPPAAHRACRHCKRMMHG